MILSLTYDCCKVMVDAVNAQKCKTFPDRASDIQSFCYGSLSVMGVLGTLSAGYLISVVGPKVVLGFVTITSIAVLIPSSLNWLGEGTTQYIFQRNNEGKKIPIEDFQNGSFNDPEESFSGTNCFSCRN